MNFKSPLLGSAVPCSLDGADGIPWVKTLFLRTLATSLTGIRKILAAVSLSQAKDKLGIRQYLNRKKTATRLIGWPFFMVRIRLQGKGAN